MKGYTNMDRAKILMSLVRAQQHGKTYIELKNRWTRGSQFEFSCYNDLKTATADSTLEKKIIQRIQIEKSKMGQKNSMIKN